MNRITESAHAPMTDIDSHPAIDAGADTTTQREPLPSSPRWMRAFGVIVFVAVLVLLSWVTPPLFDNDASSTGGGHTPPAGGHGPPTAGGG